MSTLYLDRQVASIEREGASIVIRDREGRRSNLPLHLLDRIVIRGTVGLDTSVLGHLADNGVILSTLSGRHHRLQGSFTGPLHNDARRRLGQARAYDDPAWRREWGKRLVLLKLRSQQQFLERAAEVRGQASLRSRERFWDIRVPKIDSIFDNSLVPRTSWSPGVPPQHRKLVAATHRSPI